MQTSGSRRINLGEISESVLAKLRSFDTPTICNIIELFEVRPRDHGYVRDPRIQANFPDLPPVVGFAATCGARASLPPQIIDGKSYPWLAEQIAGFTRLSGPPIVVMQDLDDPATAALFGEVMCTTYQAFGVVGLITNGAGRDLDQVYDLRFPVFTNGTIASHGYFHVPYLYVPVHIGGLVIHPDDLLHADRNGITNIPHAIAGEVADIGDEFVATEQVIFDMVKDGEPTLPAFQDAQRASKEMQEQLRQRVSRSSM